MGKPLYMDIYTLLLNGILSGKYLAYDMLPSENELASSCGASRVTVRKSLSMLESEGLIKPWHGKGYFVQPPKHSVYTLVFGDSEMDGKFRFQEVNIIRPDAEVVEMLKLKKRQMVIVARRLLERGNDAVAYDEKFIPYERGSPSIELEIHYSEFPDMFANRFVPMSLRTEMTIGAERPPNHVCTALGLPDASPLLVVSRLIFTHDEQPVGFGKQYLTEKYGKLSAKSGYYTS